MTDLSSVGAGASNLSVVVPLPDSVKPDSSFNPDQVYAHLSSKRSFFRFSPSSKRRKANDQLSDNRWSHLDNERPPQLDAWADEDDSHSDMPFVQLGETLVYSAELEEDYSRDVYRWAVLYENQRGATLFSTPYYSYLSLLPTDPPPFTMPSASRSTSSQPAVSLDSYPLPDGTWRWVSRVWMVDMRGEGQTQYDGFEYNWFFRRKHWRAEVGAMSAGGWVRRRRWVRLMMKPALSPKSLESSAAPTPHMLFQHIIHLEHHEVGNTRPPSVAPSESSKENEGRSEDGELWCGSPEEDWERCHSALRKLGTDGRQLELWRHWLCCPSQDGEKPRKPQWTEDDHVLSPETMEDLTGSALDEMTNVRQLPDKDHVAAILRSHAADILQLFVYPDSRTHFLETVSFAGLLADLNVGLGLSCPTEVLDFYSSSQNLQSLLAADSSPSVH